MCILSNDLLFLGSRLGDSLLIQYTKKEPMDSPEDEEVVSLSKLYPTAIGREARKTDEIVRFA